MNKKKNVIYITYDGLLDPLGMSQILPYLKGVAVHPRKIHVLSFEKLNRLEVNKGQLRSELGKFGIGWTPLRFTARFGSFGKVWDLFRMYFASIYITYRSKSLVAHARGHAAAQVGLSLKYLFGCKLIFDFRGLWPDERVDKGGWDLNKITHRSQYLYFKRVERLLLSRADSVIVLTEKVVPEVIRLGGIEDRITVIPCCADFNFFSLVTNVERYRTKIALSFPVEETVLGYLGSVGKMYMTERFFRLFELASLANRKVGVLALTPDVDLFMIEMNRYLPSSLHSRVRVMSVSREEVPGLLAGMDILISFITPSYARIASSPTKLAESFAAGIPAICNFGVGDVSTLIPELDAGVVIDPNVDTALISIVNQLETIIAKGGARLRLLASERLGLEIANNRYKDVYFDLDSDGKL
jgi:glycosyltransferase involved in cell wall biosynthesis